jgi:predicted Zn-dependent protease
MAVRWVACCALIAAGSGAAAAQSSGSPVLRAMQAELTRSMEKLKSQPVPPYFLSYEITETNSAMVVGEFGQIQYSYPFRRRMLDIDLRVGDYDLDNTREIRGAGMPMGGTRPSFVEIPVDDDADAIRSVLWYQTDARFKSAVEQLTKVKTNVEVKVEREDRSADFSREEPQRFTAPIVPLQVDLRRWEEKIRKDSAPFKKSGDIYNALAYFSAGVETRWLVTSEGSQIQVSQPSFQISISAATKAEDGTNLPRNESFFSFTEKGLPDDATVLKAVERMIADLEALRQAPVVDPYTGPAILSGRASGVFFHEVFGHRVEGHRQKGAEEGQTFKKKVNELVLSKDFSVYFDPTQRRLAGTDLNGHYLYDNQGIQARRVGVVENGVLKTFLMSRAPLEGFPRSNGHGRKQAGLRPVSRQSNLIVEVAPAAVQPDLKKMLIEEIKKQKLPFGLFFDDIAGGFTMTGRTIPNAFNVNPVMVYRIYADGREELVRGVDLIGTPLTAFSKIVAADRHVGVFNGTCGAESGMVPVSAVSPGIFISQIEVQKKQKSHDRPPILPAPLEGGN